MTTAALRSVASEPALPLPRARRLSADARRIAPAAPPAPFLKWVGCKGRLLPLLTPSTLALAEQWALVPLQMRGFGHVKQANVAQAQRRSAELLHRLAPQHFARPAPADAPAAGQFKGIRITQGS